MSNIPDAPTPEALNRLADAFDAYRKAVDKIKAAAEPLANVDHDELVAAGIAADCAAEVTSDQLCLYAQTGANMARVAATDLPEAKADDVSGDDQPTEETTETVGSDGDDANTELVADSKQATEEPGDKNAVEDAKPTPSPGKVSMKWPDSAKKKTGKTGNKAKVS